MKKNVLQTILYSLLLSSCYSQTTYPPINPMGIEIARDKWGVAHIFASINAEVAYGLAWANAEDAFKQMQELIIITNSFMGRHNGIDGAGYDFFVHSLDIEQVYQENIAAMSPDFLRYLDGYVQGINAYAAAHPKDIIYKKTFPVTSKKLLQAYVIAFSALGGSSDHVSNIMKGKYDAKLHYDQKGSNGYAFSSIKTDSGKTFLAVNPHFYVDGAFSFYEAHLCSEEGLNMTGALFQGGTCIFMGNNKDLGWGKTYNHLDLTDVFELKMNPKNKLQYEWDGGWKTLEKRPVWLKVRLGGKAAAKGGIVLPVRKMAYWSEYGPAYQSPNKQFYSLRSPAFSNLKAPEQYYRMNLARNFDEFKSALSINGLVMFNIVYADKDDHIFYICNGKVPIRNPKYDYRKPLLGNTSEHLWNTYYKWSDLPHQIDPPCGYVFNTNNSPLKASCEWADSNNTSFLRYVCLRNGLNNRAIRFTELVEAKDKFSFEEFKAIKFDEQISLKSPVFVSIRDLEQRVRPENYPAIADVLTAMYSWKGDGSPSNKEATLWVLAFDHIFRELHLSDDVFMNGFPPFADSIFVDAMVLAKASLLKHFNTISVPLNELHCHVRNGKNHEVRGFPDALSPIYGTPFEGGKLKMLFADTYIHFVQFGKDGAEKIETLLPFEQTHTCEQYVDELEMFHHRVENHVFRQSRYSKKRSEKICPYGKT